MKSEPRRRTGAGCHQHDFPSLSTGLSPTPRNCWADTRWTWTAPERRGPSSCASLAVCGLTWRFWTAGPWPRARIHPWQPEKRFPSFLAQALNKYLRREGARRGDWQATTHPPTLDKIKSQNRSVCFISLTALLFREGGASSRWGDPFVQFWCLYRAGVNFPGSFMTQHRAFPVCYRVGLCSSHRLQPTPSRILCCSGELISLKINDLAVACLLFALIRMYNSIEKLKYICYCIILQGISNASRKW